MIKLTRIEGLLSSLKDVMVVLAAVLYVYMLAVPFAIIALIIQFDTTQVSDWFPYEVFGYKMFFLTMFDYILGTNEQNVPKRFERTIGRLFAFRLLVLVSAGLGGLFVLYSCVVFSTYDHFGIVGLAGLALLLGRLSAIVCIVYAHELIHSLRRAERLIGGLMLCMVCYPSFKIEHVHHHHRYAATDQDGSSARRNESLYQFWIRAIPTNLRHSMQLSLSGDIPSDFGKAPELPVWFLVIAIIVLVIYALGGFTAVGIFLAQSAIAILHLEAINYVQHYGLERRRRDDGSYEPVTEEHSWNTLFWNEQFSFINLGRHSDHHLYQARPFQLLRVSENAPKLPIPLNLAIYLAMIPPLWERLVHPRLDVLNRKLAPDG